jgi:choice-of-anchor A domain-containing protein
MKLVKCLLGTVLIAAAAPLFAGSLLNGYNVLILNNFTAGNSDSQVPIAIGGNATTSNYGFYPSSNSAVPGNYGTVVGGNLTMTNGGPSPSTYVAGSASLTNTSCNIGCVHTGGSSPVNFSLVQSQMLNESSYLSGLVSNGTVIDQYSALLFTAGKANQSLYVFSINASQLTSGYSYMNFVGTGNAPVIINVNGSTAAGSSIVNGGFQGVNGSNVLFNFYNASQVTVSAFNASILAPNATVYGNSGNFEGTLVANNFTGGSTTSEFDPNDSFTGTLVIPTTSPEPASASLLIAGLLMALGSVRFRRRKHVA